MPRLAQPLALHHLAVVVADLGRAERFYVGVLGLPVLARHEDTEGNPRSVWVSLGAGAAADQHQVFLAIERAAAPDPRRADEAPGLHCVALGIAADDRAAWREKLQAAGHPIERASPFTLYTRDPDGVLVALSHHPTPSDL